MSYNISTYIQEKSTIKAKIEAIDAIIDAMLTQALNIVENEGTASYSLDDGQVKISTQYTSMEQVEQGIRSLERLRNMYLNRLNGNITILRGKLNY